MIKASSLTFQNKSDLIGAFSSGLCLLHCIATPFLFITQASLTNCCEASHTWWKSMDYLFLIISFAAVYRSNQTTSKAWIGKALWGSWIILFMVILNEKLEWLALPEIAIYFPALALIILHLYNQKYCQCDENCIH